METSWTVQELVDYLSNLTDKSTPIYLWNEQDSSVYTRFEIEAIKERVYLNFNTKEEAE